MSDQQRFTLTAEHIKLLRAMYVSWCDDEYGAPAIDPKRPYGNSDVEGDMAELLGADVDTEARYLRLMHEKTATALQIVLATGTFEPGEYVASPYGNDWRRAERGRASDG